MQTLTWLGCIALGLVLGGAAHAENIKIGVILPYSGANADLGDVQDKGLIAAHFDRVAQYGVGPRNGHCPHSSAEAGAHPSP